MKYGFTKNKFTISLCITMLAVALLFTGCAEDTPLPSYSVDIPPSADIPTVEPSHTYADVNFGQNNTTTEPTIMNEGDPITADGVKETFTSLISGEFRSTQEGDFTYHTANLLSGGTLSVVTYDDQYYQSEIRMPLETSNASDVIDEVLATYICRPLASSETKELQDIIGSIYGGSTYEYFSAIANSAEVYIIAENGELIVQAK